MGDIPAEKTKKLRKKMDNLGRGLRMLTNWCNARDYPGSPSRELNELKTTWENIKGNEGAKFNEKKVECLYQFLDIDGRRACGSKGILSKEGKSAAVVQKVIDMGDKVFDSFTQKGVAADLTSDLESVVAALREKTSRTPGIGKPSSTREEFLNNRTFVDSLINLIQSFKHSTENCNIETALAQERTGD